MPELIKTRSGRMLTRDLLSEPQLRQIEEDRSIRPFKPVEVQGSFLVFRVRDPASAKRIRGDDGKLIPDMSTARDFTEVRVLRRRGSRIFEGLFETAGHRLVVMRSSSESKPAGGRDLTLEAHEAKVKDSLLTEGREQIGTINAIFPRDSRTAQCNHEDIKVSPRFRNLGIGHELYRRMEEMLTAAGIEHFMIMRICGQNEETFRILRERNYEILSSGYNIFASKRLQKGY
jgi:ribosomal protein S18 acetylase RimI-like enzyme